MSYVSLYDAMGVQFKHPQLSLSLSPVVRRR